MTIMSLEPGTDAEAFEWPRPGVEGFTAEDLDRLPGLPPHTELIDGSLVVVSPQAMFHSLVMRHLEAILLRAAPAEFNIVREMTVRLDKRNRPEPDLMAVRASAVKGLSQTCFQPDDVRLAVEVVSPDSVDRDRVIKPPKFAAAGIRHFWRVENVDDEAVVYVYELDPATRTYGLSGIHHDRLKVTVPFDLEIELAELVRLR